MTIETRFTQNDNALIIAIKGRFAFNLLNDFKQSYIDETRTPSQFTIDMKNATDIDSSALGMLLKMKSALGKDDGEIHIINCNSTVLKIFQISQFKNLFTIS